MDMGTIIEQEEYSIGTIIGPEKFEREYKEFKLMKVPFNISSKVARHIIQQNDYTLLENIYNDTIRKYIYEYVPKYISVFGNTKSNEHTHGELYIGVADSGKVIGIPLINMTHDHIHNLVLDSINSMQINNSIKQTIINNVNVEVINVELNPENVEDNVDNIIEDYYYKLQMYNNLEQEYIKMRKKWLKKYNYYRKAINSILNNPSIRVELISYITSLVKYDQDKYNHKSIYKIVQRLYNPEHIYYNRGEIKELKHDPTTIAYWIVNFRDYKIHQLDMVKPQYHYMKKPKNPHINIIKHNNPIISRIKQLGIDACIIKISCPFNITHNDKIEYNYNDNVRVYNRTIDKQGRPFCMNLNCPY
jgi:hypothetical protein